MYFSPIFMKISQSSPRVSLRGTEEPGLFNFLIAGRNIKQSELVQNLDRLREVITEHTGNRGGLKLGDCPWVSHYTSVHSCHPKVIDSHGICILRPNIRMVDQFCVGRVFIAGDSAHVHSPTGGQGVNTGIQDSFNLGWKLALVIKQLASPSLLQTYAEERRPVVAEMLNQTTQMLDQTFKDGEEKGWSRDTGLLQLGVNYRWSSIVCDERQVLEARYEADYYDPYGILDDDEEDDINVGVDSNGSTVDGVLCAGDRAPDATNLIDRSASSLFLSTYSLFQIFSSHYHTVLIFSKLKKPKSVLRYLKSCPAGTVRSVVVAPRGRLTVSNADIQDADIVLEDRDGHAHDAYIPGQVCGVVAIRPDGMVGAIVQNEQWLHKYFMGIFSGEAGKF